MMVYLGTGAECKEEVPVPNSMTNAIMSVHPHPKAPTVVMRNNEMRQRGSSHETSTSLKR